MTLSEATRKWTKGMESENTADTYLRHFDRLVAYLGSQNRPNDIAEFTEDNLRGFIAYLRDQGLGNNSIRGAMSALSSFATWAMTEPHPRRRSEHLVEKNPVQHIKRPKHVEPPERWLTEDQLLELLRAIEDASPGEKLACCLVADQPLRASEWCKAKVKSLVLDSDEDVCIEVRVKGGGLRKKKLGKDVATMLTAYLRQREAKPEEPLLLNSQGRKWSRQGFSNMIARWTIRAGLGRAGAHMIRHTIASMAAKDGATVYEIAEMLNHRSLQTAQKYIHGVKGDAALGKIRDRIWAK